MISAVAPKRYGDRFISVRVCSALSLSSFADPLDHSSFTLASLVTIRQKDLVCTSTTLHQLSNLPPRLRRRRLQSTAPASPRPRSNEHFHHPSRSSTATDTFFFFHLVAPSSLLYPGQPPPIPPPLSFLKSCILVDLSCSQRSWCSHLSVCLLRSGETVSREIVKLDASSAFSARPSLTFPFFRASLDSLQVRSVCVMGDQTVCALHSCI